MRKSIVLALASDIAEQRQESSQRLEVGLFSDDIDNLSTFKHETVSNIVYLFNGGTLNCNRDLMDAEWIEIYKDEAQRARFLKIDPINYLAIDNVGNRLFID